MDSIANSCMRADTSTAWLQAAAAWTARADQPVAYDSLRKHLLVLRDRDQDLRVIPGFADSVASPTFQRRIAIVDSMNADELTRIIETHGWPTRSLVGSDGASAAFLIAQHNPRIQRQALRLMLDLPAGEVNSADLALLEDRVLVREGKPQRYGSQIRSAEGGAPQAFYPIDDVANLDVRRARVGLPPFGVYLCMMRGMTGSSIPDPRAEQQTAP